MTVGDANGRDGLEALPAAYVGWRASALGRITDALEQDLILDLVGSPVGLHVLDVGCGDGVLALKLAARGARATGVDVSSRMIEVAERRARQEGRNARFGVAEAENLPFASDSFDALLAVTVLCLIEDTGSALREMRRVLKPGGRLIVGELGRSSSWAAARRVKGWLGASLWRSARFSSPSDLERLATGAGLVDASVSGAIFYPPIGMAARLLGPIDRWLGACTTLGAAFLVLLATKPRGASTRGGAEFAQP